MTYAEWSTSDRTFMSPADFAVVHEALFGSNPFLREGYDFAHWNGHQFPDLGRGASVTAFVVSGNSAVVAADLTQAAIKRANGETDRTP